MYWGGGSSPDYIVLPLWLRVDTFRITYTYPVAISATEAFAEQRKQLGANFRRTLSSRAYATDSDMDLLGHLLLAAEGRWVAAPIISECLTPYYDNLSGRSSIRTEESLWKFFNVARVPYVVVANVTRWDYYEVHEVDTVDTFSDRIDLKSTITSDFPKATTRVYPAIRGVVGHATVQLESSAGYMAEIVVVEPIPAPDKEGGGAPE